MGTRKGSPCLFLVGGSARSLRSRRNDSFDLSPCPSPNGGMAPTSLNRRTAFAKFLFLFRTQLSEHRRFGRCGHREGVFTAEFQHIKALAQRVLFGPVVILDRGHRHA